MPLEYIHYERNDLEFNNCEGKSQLTDSAQIHFYNLTTSSDHKSVETDCNLRFQKGRLGFKIKIDMKLGGKLVSVGFKNVVGTTLESYKMMVS